MFVWGLRTHNYSGCVALAQPASPVHTVEGDLGQAVESMSLEIVLLEVRVHVHSRGSKVVGPTDVRDYALATFTNFLNPHPHVPVPQLKEGVGVGSKVIFL